LYQEKKIFYDSLSIVLNKYTVPVGNWGLFEGTFGGMQSLIGKSQFSFESENNQIILSIKNIPPLHFSENDIDTNAFERIESISTIFDTTFEQFANLDKNRIIHAAIAGMANTLEPD
jgi:hypothetical protein